MGRKKEKRKEKPDRKDRDSAHILEKIPAKVLVVIATVGPPLASLALVLSSADSDPSGGERAAGGSNRRKRPRRSPRRTSSRNWTVFENESAESNSERHSTATSDSDVSDVRRDAGRKRKKISKRKRSHQKLCRK